MHAWADRHTRRKRGCPINKSAARRGQVESSPADTSSVPSLRPVATPVSALCPSAGLRLCTQIRFRSLLRGRFPCARTQIGPRIGVWSCVVLLCQRRQRGKGGVAGLGFGGVIPTKTRLQSLRGRMCWLTGRFSQDVSRRWTGSGDPDS